MQLNVGGTANMAVAGGNLPPVAGTPNRHYLVSDGQGGLAGW
jgi:hypothetical protein